MLDGGAGNDLLQGGTGNDVYLFGRGDGQDLLRNRKSDYSGNLETDQATATDIRRFKVGVSGGDLGGGRSTDNLIRKIRGKTEQMT